MMSKNYKPLIKTEEGFQDQLLEFSGLRLQSYSLCRNVHEYLGKKSYEAFTKFNTNKHLEKNPSKIIIGVFLDVIKLIS